MIVRDVVRAARDLHPAFDDHGHPDAGALRFLDGYQTQLFADALIRYPSLWSETQEVALPLADFDAGIALDTPFFVDDIFLTVGSATAPVREVPYEHRFDNGLPVRFVWKVNQTLYLSQTAASWSHASKITIRFSKRPTTLTTMADGLQVPDHAEMTLRYAICEMWAMRGTQRTDITPPDVRDFARKHELARDMFLDQLWLLRSSAPRFTRDVGD